MIFIGWGLRVTGSGRVWCRGQGKGSIQIHSRKTVMIITLLAHGCPRQAIVAAFGVDERTVQDLERSAGQHCQDVHEHLVERPRDLGQVQADEIRVKIQGAILWMAMALQVSTRLWLGGVLDTSRNTGLLMALIEKVRRSALCHPFLFCVDGCQTYLGAIRRVFREPISTGGRPRLRPWDGIYIAQVVKQYARKRVVGVKRRIVQGTQEQIDRLLDQTQGGGVINTAFIERLNATFRSRLCPLVRRGRALARQKTSLRAAMYLVGTVYNFCTYHKGRRRSICPRTEHGGFNEHRPLWPESPTTAGRSMSCCVFRFTLRVGSRQNGGDDVRMPRKRSLPGGVRDHG